MKFYYEMEVCYFWILEHVKKKKKKGRKGIKDLRLSYVLIIIMTTIVKTLVASERY